MVIWLYYKTFLYKSHDCIVKLIYFALYLLYASLVPPKLE